MYTVKFAIIIILICSKLLSLSLLLRLNKLEKKINEMKKKKEAK